MILKNGKRIDGCTDTLPVGTVQPFLGLTPPLGYLVCQGQLISKVEYPELYKICGSTFGIETSTHFYLPDLRGKTLAGYDQDNAAMNSIGKLLGQAEHTHAIPNHSHTYSLRYSSYWDAFVQFADDNGADTLLAARQKNGSYKKAFTYQSTKLDTNMNLGVESSRQTVSTTAHFQVDGDTSEVNTTAGTTSNYQPTVTVNWIVKAAMLIPEYFIVENTLTSTSTSNALSAAQGKILNDKINSLSTVASTGSYNDLINKPERVDYLSQITCTYGTLNSNFNYCFLKDDVVYLNLTYTLKTGLTAGTQYDFCKIPAAIRPKGNVIMYAFSHTVSHMITNYVRSTGELVISPEKDVPAGKEINMWTVYYIK